MSDKPMRPCRYKGCPQLTEDASGYCPEHLKLTKELIWKSYDEQRGTAAERGYDRRWSKYRKAYLADYPLCVRCFEKTPPVIREATVVDHIVPHHGDYKLFWDPSNHQSLCDECHHIKTAREDGAFRNPVKGIEKT